VLSNQNQILRRDDFNDDTNVNPFIRALPPSWFKVQEIQIAEREQRSIALQRIYFKPYFVGIDKILDQFVSRASFRTVNKNAP